VNAAAAVFFALAGVAAVVDWVAVARGNVAVERMAKPATLALLVLVALVLDPVHDGERAWFVVALCLSLAGDVLLMPPKHRFVRGLLAFLVAHLAYVAGFVAAGVTLVHVAIGIVLMAFIGHSVGRPVVTAVRGGDDRSLAGPVTFYLVVISAMVAAAIGTGDWIAAAGALLFYSSDGLIAWNKFKKPMGWAPVAIMVTYHAAQATLVASLV
jgi:uncharacterized membrane protein YhhN